MILRNGSVLQEAFGLEKEAAEVSGDWLWLWGALPSLNRCRWEGTPGAGLTCCKEQEGHPDFLLPMAL